MKAFSRDAHVLNECNFITNTTVGSHFNVASLDIKLQKYNYRYLRPLCDRQVQ